MHWYVCGTCDGLAHPVRTALENNDTNRPTYEIIFVKSATYPIEFHPVVDVSVWTTIWCVCPEKAKTSLVAG